MTNITINNACIPTIIVSNAIVPIVSKTLSIGGINQNQVTGLGTALDSKWDVTRSTSIFRNRIFAIGDSVTEQGNNPVTDTSLVYGGVNRLSYLMWACLASHGKLQYTGVAATGGYTTGQILDVHLPVALLRKPDFCVVLGGYNDFANGVPYSTTISNLAEMYSQLSSAGIIPICCGLSPREEDYANPSLIVQFNQWISRKAGENGWPYVNFYNLLTNWEDGHFLPGVNMDTVHQEGSGRRLMGNAIWQAISDRVQGANAYLAQSDADNLTLLAHPLFGGTPDSHGVPPSWGEVDGIVTDGVTYTYVNDPGCRGNMIQVTQGSGTTNGLVSYGFEVSPNDVIYFGMKVGASVLGAGGGWQVRLCGASTLVDLFSLTEMNQDQSTTIFSGITQIPSGWTDLINIVLQTTDGLGGNLRVGQVTLLNLTQQGLI